MRAGTPSLGRVGPDHRLQRGLKHRHPYRRQRLAHIGHLEHAQQIGRRDPRQFPPAQGARRGDRPHRIGVSACGRHQCLRHPVGVDVTQLRSLRAVGIELDDLRSPHQQLGHIRGRAQHLHQPLGHRALVAQRRQVPPLLGELLADAPICQQTGVGVGCVGKPVEQRRQQHLLHTTAAAALHWSTPPDASARSAAPRSPAPPADVRRPPASYPPKDQAPVGQPIPAAVGRTAWRVAGTHACSAA